MIQCRYVIYVYIFKRFYCMKYCCNNKYYYLKKVVTSLFIDRYSRHNCENNSKLPKINDGHDLILIELHLE